MSVLVLQEGGYEIGHYDSLEEAKSRLSGEDDKGCEYWLFDEETGDLLTVKHYDNSWS